MTAENDCKGCSASVRISEEEIEKIFSSMKVKKVKLTSKKEYINRLNICQNCQFLDYNTTCRHCGCIVQIKAKIAKASCPAPENPKW